MLIIRIHNFFGVINSSGIFTIENIEFYFINTIKIKSVKIIHNANDRYRNDTFTIDGSKPGDRFPRKYNYQFSYSHDSAVIDITSNFQSIREMKLRNGNSYRFVIRYKSFLI